MKVNLEAEEISPQRHREHEVPLKALMKSGFWATARWKKWKDGGWKGGRLGNARWATVGRPDLRAGRRESSHRVTRLKGDRRPPSPKRPSRFRWELEGFPIFHTSILPSSHPPILSHWRTSKFAAIPFKYEQDSR